MSVEFRPFKVSVPATTANLGAGFDCLGLALNIRNELEVRPSDRLRLQVSGEGKGILPENENNLTWRTFCELWDGLGSETPPCEIVCRNRIPLARGLGSSAAVRIAALLAANHLAGNPLSQDEILQRAVSAEGHPDNVGPALLGGMVVCGRCGDEAVFRRVEPAPGLRVVLLIPDKMLETSEARGVLPQTVSLSDSVVNVQNAALTTVAFLTGDYGILSSSLEDRLHQPYRKALMPGFVEALEAAKSAGAYGAALSGAGTTIAAFAEENEEAIAQAMQCAFAAAGGGESRTGVAEVDRVGAFISDLAE